MNRKNIISAGLALAWTAALMLITGYRLWYNLLLYILTALYLFLFLRFFFLPKILLRFKTIRKVIFPLAGLLALGCVFFFDIKFSESYYYPDTELTVNATGRKDDSAELSEVWISAINLDGRRMDLTAYEDVADWRIIEGSLVSVPETQPAQLSINTGYAGKAVIEMAINPTSGIVEINGNGESMEVNLYEADPYLGVREYDISPLLNKEIPYAPVRRIAFYGLQFLLLYPLALSLLYYILKKREIK